VSGGLGRGLTEPACGGGDARSSGVWGRENHGKICSANKKEPEKKTLYEAKTSKKAFKRNHRTTKKTTKRKESNGRGGPRSIKPEAVLKKKQRVAKSGVFPGDIRRLRIKKHWGADGGRLSWGFELEG